MSSLVRDHLNFSEKKTLLFVIIIFGVLAVYRGIHLWITGFYVSDEFGYVMVAINGTYWIFNHQFAAFRPFLLNINFFLFHLLGIDTGSKFAMFLPFCLFFWNVLLMISAYGILKLLGLDKRTVNFCLLFSVFLVGVVVLGQGFLSEGPSVALAMFGVFLFVLYAKSRHRMAITLPFFIGLTFAATSYMREPYRIFLLLGVIVVAILSWIRSSEFKLSKKIGMLFLIFSVMLFVAGWYVGYNTPEITTYQPPVYQLPTGQVVTVRPETTNQTITTTAIINETSTTRTSSVIQDQFLSPLSLMVSGINAHGFILTVTMFFLGLFSALNPFLGLFSLVGILILTKTVIKTRNSVYIAAFSCSLISILQYIAVSALMTSGAAFRISENLSTIIRYGQMITPIYFLGVPFVIKRLSKRNLLTIFVLLLVFSIGAFGVYQQSMQTHLSFGYPYANGQMIFDLDYRTPFARLRDDIVANKFSGQIIVFGEPCDRSYYDNFTIHWNMIPGTENLPHVTFYPYVSENTFDILRPSTFYIYGEANDSIAKMVNHAPYLLHFIFFDKEYGNTDWYQVENLRVVHSGSDAIIILVELSWLR